jgi:hypothetical protein
VYAAVAFNGIFRFKVVIGTGKVCNKFGGYGVALKLYAGAADSSDEVNTCHGFDVGLALKKSACSFARLIAG